jgi:DNA-binding response OmpR family regulator
MLTAKSERADVARGLALGADGYITKPYGRNTLDYMLRYVMKQENSSV